MKPISLREKAISYRKKGYSYNMIKAKMELSKSTLSDWLRDIPFIPNKQVLERIGSAKLKSARFKNQQRINNVQEMRELAKNEVGILTKRDLWFLGIGLYLGEGTKMNETVRISNSDPGVIKIILKWFKEVCGLKDENFTLLLYSYPDIDVDWAINYWSKITGLPKKQFAKTQIDVRNNKLKKKQNKLPYGTLHIRVRSYGKKDFGRSLHRRIMGWIETSINQI